LSSDSSKLNGAQRLLEAGLLITTIVAMFIMLALFTFNPADPGWSQTGYQIPVRNVGGAVGAYISDFLLNIFGVIAFTLPLLIAFTGWLLFQRFYRLIQLDYFTLGLKVIGFILFYTGITAIASMNFDDIYYFSAGGIIGDFVSGSLLPFLSFVGTTLLFLMFILVGFVLLTGISWLTLIDLLGKYCIKIIQFLIGVPNSLKTRFSKNTHSTNNRVDDKTIEPVEKTTNKLDKKLSKSPTISPIIDELPEPEMENTGEMVSIEKNIEEPIPFSATDDDTDEPFLDIDDLLGGPIEVNVQEHVSDDEIAAAFEQVEPINIPPVVNVNADTALTIDETIGTLPSLDLLDRPDKAENPINQEDLDQVSRLVEAKLKEFGVIAEVVGVYPGPVITRFEIDLAPGVKVSKITGLSKDLARSLSAKAVRVVEVIPGKSVIGLELPNKHREIVPLRDIISSKEFVDSPSPLTMAIGADIAGDPVVVDLGKMPHLLVAGTTGSGKSVAVNTMILSLLYKSTPEDVRLIMIDPKMLELSVYEGIPHLLSEVVTDMKDAANALRWCVGEMERRYKLMSLLGVRNLKGYNIKIKNAIDAGTPIIDPTWQASDAFDQTPPELGKLPSIVVIVDEFADMMMVVGKKAEELIARIAQKARAAGIHLVLATQRPSVDVITGLIKANIPTRMALQVQSRIDSRTILDQQGAEQLLGWGDMFYLPPGSGVPTRVHGAFVDDHEVHAVVKDWKSRGEPNYIEEIVSGDVDNEILLPGEQAEGEESELDTLYDEAVGFVTEGRRVSISSIQRKFRIGYNRAARIVEDMENQGVVSAPGHNGAREVLAPPPVKG
jgi:S-DNA-T family DNA segregation ATPase FtsK/SpoIIIE